MSNKNLKILCVVLGIVIIIISILIIKREYVTKSEKRFKLEYENFNDKTSLSFEKPYPKVNIDIHNNIEYISGKEMIDIVKNKTGVILLAYPECIKMRMIMDTFLDTCNKMGIEKIYYLSSYSIRDEKVKEKDSINTLRKATKEYNQLLELFGNKAVDYKEIDDGSKRIYFPTIIFVKDGKIIDLYQTSDVEDETSFNNLSKDEENKFIETLKKYIKKIK